MCRNDMAIVIVCGICGDDRHINTKSISDIQHDKYDFI